MTWAAIAIGGAAVVGAGIGYLSSENSADAAEDAANIQAAAANNASQLAYKQWQQTYGDLAPYREAGTGAVNQLAAGMAPGGRFAAPPNYEDLQGDPGYQFRLQEGRNQLLAAGAAAGNYGSGNMGVALQNYGQNVASNEYAQAYSRWQDTYNRLAGLAGTGQTAVNQTGQMGAAAASNMGNYLVGGAQAQAAGQVGAANAWASGNANALNQGMSGLGTYLRYQQQQQLVNQLAAGGDTPTSYGQSYYGGAGYGTTYDYPGAY